MTILRRFITIEWFKAFLMALMALLFIMSVADLINGFLRSSVTTIEVLYNYLFNVPGFISRSLPVACLLATLFSINKLKSHSELIAILASGFSAMQIIALIFISSLCISLMQFSLLGYVIPKSKIVRLNFMGDHLKGKFKQNKEKGLKTSSLATGLIWYKSPDYYVSFSAFNKNNSSLINATFYYFLPEEYKASKIIKSPVAKYVSNNVWNLSDALIIDKLSTNSFPEQNFMPSLNLKLNEEAQDFDQIEADIETLTVRSLSNFLSHLKDSGINIRDYEKIFYEIFSMSLFCLVFGLVPARAIFEPNRRNSTFGKNVIFALVFTILYYVIYSSAASLGSSGKIPVSFAVFLVPVASLIYCLAHFFKKRKL